MTTKSEILDGMTMRQRGAFEVARVAAAGVLRRRLRLLVLVLNAYRKLYVNEPAIASVRGDMVQLFRLANAWARREYTSLPWRSILYAVAAIIYFVNPIDLIPDALLGIGFIDDVAVISVVVRAIRRDIMDFQTWEAARFNGRIPRRLRVAA